MKEPHDTVYEISAIHFHCFTVANWSMTSSKLIFSKFSISMLRSANYLDAFVQLKRSNMIEHVLVAERPFTAGY